MEDPLKPTNNYPRKPGSRRYRTIQERTLWSSLGLTLLLAAACLLLKSPLYLAYIAGINIVTFGYYGYDKAQAKNKGWRVPEFNLHLLAWLGGAAGGIIGMVLFNHKTSKQNFVIILGSSLILHFIIFVVILMFFDQALLTSYDWLEKLRTSGRR